MHKGDDIMDILERNHVTVFGEGEQTIVFAHGFGCDQSMWRFITPYFEKQYRIVLFDYVGSGQSKLDAYDSKKYRTLHGYKEDLLDVLNALSLENVIFVGHSISSMIGLLAALDAPDKFSSLTMIGPSPRYINEEGYKGGFEESDIHELLDLMEMNFMGWASAMVPMVTDAQGTVLTEELERTFVEVDPHVAREFAEVTFFTDCRQELEKLEKPTLVIQCSEDSIVPIHVGQYLHKHLKNSEFQLMNVRGHYPHISKPYETAEYVKAFLRD